MRSALTLSLCACLAPTLAHAATPGFTEDFAAGTTAGFQGGSLSFTNPGTDGVGGAADGFLLASLAFTSSFGCNTSDPAFTGDYPASGIGGISFWLKDVGAAQPFEMHIALGPGVSNFWQYNAPFVPTPQWKKFYINLATINPAQWTRTHGNGTLADAFATVFVVLFRHDLPPFMTAPDPIQGDLGIDRIRLHPPCPGETNGDDVVDFSDLNNVLSNFGQPGINLPGDVNNDGVVDFPDLNIVLSNFGNAC